MPSSKTKRRTSHGSGNPAIATAKDFRKRQEGHAVTLPSGVTVLARRAGLKVFLASGVIPDYLTPIVAKAVAGKQGLTKDKQAEILADPKALLETQEMLDRCLVMTLVAPDISVPPGCADCGRVLRFGAEDWHNRESDKFEHEYIQAERDEESLYTDEVSDEDKIFLFQWSVGGGADLESFRSELSESMGALETLATGVGETEQPVTDNG